jgi:molybdopterin-guanine dinucleotide biosynthesis protein A
LPDGEYDAVILAGGAGRRLGGVDKAGLVIGGMPLLDRVLLASASARYTVVVGSPRSTIRPVSWTEEEPSGGGPVAGLSAGLDALDEAPGGALGVLLVLATDLTQLGADDVLRLLRTLQADPTTDAAQFVDADGRAQPLAAVYRTQSLRRALATVGPVHGTAVKLVMQRLAVASVPDLGAAQDCDTPDQLAAARAHFEHLEGQGRR